MTFWLGVLISKLSKQTRLIPSAIWCTRLSARRTPRRTLRANPSIQYTMCVLYFHFRCILLRYFYLYLSNSTSGPWFYLQRIPLQHSRLCALCASIIRPVSSPPWRVLEIIKSSLSQDWLLCLEPLLALILPTVLQPQQYDAGIHE